MSARSQKWMQLIVRTLGWSVGIVVIGVAISAALAQSLLPLLARHPEWVAAQLSARAHHPVSFASLEGRWEPSGPLFVMHDVTIGPGDGGSPIHLPQAELKLDFGGWLVPSRHFLNLEARGLVLDVGRDAQGVWHINGVGMAGGSDRQNVSFGNLSMELWLDDLRLDITEAVHGTHYSLMADQLRLSRQGSHIRIGALLHRVGTVGELHGAGIFRDDGSNGRMWLSAAGVDLHSMLAGVDLGGYQVDNGRGDIASWLDWKHGKVVRNVTRVDLNSLTIANPSGAKVVAPAIHGVAELRLDDAGYNVRWASDDGGAMVVAVNQWGTAQARIDAAASNLQLAPLVPWIALKPNLSPTVAQWVGAGQPRGRLQHVLLHWNATDSVQELDVTFDGVGINPVGKLPGIDHLQGEVRGDVGAVTLELPTQSTTINFQHTFRAPFVMSKLGGDLAFWHDDGAWHIGIAGLNFQGAGYGGEARGEIALPDGGGSPFLDLYASIPHADITAAKLFWPVSVMPATAVSWLDRALVAGTLDNASVVVRGALSDWPFHHNEGRFEANANMTNVTLDYGPDWPRVEALNAVASFVDNGMMVQATSAQSMGLKLDKAVALIPEFGNVTLDLNVDGSGSGGALLDFVSKTPIARQQADVLSKLKLGGSGDFNFHLSLPMGDINDFTLSGAAQLKDVDADAPEWGLKLDKLRGPSTFDRHGFHAGPLDTTFRGQPSKLDLAVAGATGDPATALSATLTGAYSVPELIQGYSTLKWLGDITSGRGNFNLGYQLVRSKGSDAYNQTLTVDSPLTGIAMNFPVPMKKTVDTSLPLHLTMGLPTAGSDLQLALGSVVRGRFRLPANDSQALAAAFNFGDQMPDSLPAKGLRIRGTAEQLDVTGWVKQSVGGTGNGGGLSLESIDVDAQHATLFDRDFASMHIITLPKPDTLEFDVDSAAIAGHISVPTADLNKRGITARLKHLYWPKTVSATPQKNTPSIPPAEAANTGIDPASLPPLHLSLDDLRLGDSKLGQGRLETWPITTGMHIDQLSTQSKSVQINASGDWNGTPSSSRTHLRIDFSAQNVGDMLSALGYDGLFTGGKTEDELDATWPGGPWALELDNMEGKLGINISNGSIPEASAPNAGRLLGLISVVDLPRRLSLDFGDVFGKGFAFDSIVGDFKLSNGNATTDNLKIHSSAAEVSITGRTGLRAKDFDQQMQVVPHIGNSLPVVGAVVGGPVGIAAGLAVQGLLGKGLNHVAVRRYRITGSWEKPVMTPIDKRDFLQDVLPSSSSVLAPATSGSAPATSSSSGY